MKTRERRRTGSAGTSGRERICPGLERLRTELAKLGEGVDPGEVGEAFDRALELASREGEDDAGLRVARCSLVADVLGLAVSRRHVARSELEPVVEVVGQDEAPFLKHAVFALASRSPAILGLPPATAIHAELRLLFLFAPISEASFWFWGPDDPVHVVAHVGPRAPTRTSETAARRTIFGRPSPETRHAFIHTVPVSCRQAVRGALVFRARPADAKSACRQARQLTSALELILDRDLLLERSAAGGRSIVEAGERRLRRIGLDLHDGPLQEFARFYGDLQMLRHRLVATGVEPKLMPIARDLDALLSLASDLQASLRETSRSLGLPPDIRESLDGALAHEVRTLENAGIRADLRLTGDPQTLTESQRIALARILQEALANIRLHSEASSVRMEIAIVDGGVRLEVADDGRGFEVERVLRRAPRRGRLGLIGMRERARLLGGSASVESRPGGPTSIVAVLPPWRPIASVEDARDPSD